ncbi:uncharacterized protein N7482_003294 [Penicillium canariense]|uniref:WW domain-containing protein n=1 Tax=Penicillium canariense TaxID=189055 RepID=A0A9W9I4A5_9EURO|nr:uncharacterized protein N7482_003294 [Penicillium canariense]KAJ5167700.1 hypothetical protein N7482_003294 [Penicillium canariense]
MAQDAPEDTAGPSSPPPQLPEGWLPQWEGVQRKWYYVQRATGKSQWDIPTEPVVLTPSTTPTSIGTGPSQAPPSRPSTNSPRVTTTGNTLVERMESVADGAKISSSLSSELNGQPGASMQGSLGALGWHPNQISQNGPRAYAQHFSPGNGGYGPDQSHQTVSGNVAPGAATVFPSHGQPLVQSHQQPTWGNHTQITQAHPSGPSASHSAESYRRFGDSQQACHMSAYPSSIDYPENQLPRLSTFLPPQPKWQLEEHHANPRHAPEIPSGNYASSTLSQPYFNSYTTPQTTVQSPPNFASSSTQSSNPSHPGSAFSGSQEGLQHPQSTFSAHSHASTDQANVPAEHPLSQSHSHQSFGFQQDPQTSLRGYPPQSLNDQGSYQSTSMSRTHSGAGFNSMVLLTTPEFHGGARYYQNPLIQTGIHQYLPPQPEIGTLNTTSVHTGTEYHPRGGQLSGYQGQWTNSAGGSRIAASDAQFVSGPWASSTPPTSGPPTQSHYG